VSDPILATHNIQRAAEHHGATFLFKHKVVEMRQEDGRVTGVLVVSNDGENTVEIPAAVVVNVGGPHSCQITDMAFESSSTTGVGVQNDMLVHTRPLKQEVCFIDSPQVSRLAAAVVGSTYKAVVAARLLLLVLLLLLLVLLLLLILLLLLLLLQMPDPDVVTPISVDFDVGVYWRPELDSRLVVGTVEPECDELHWVKDKDADQVSESAKHILHCLLTALPIDYTAY
jgi:glycine/D-amino acid oxidase-like deaminating enzyme